MITELFCSIDDFCQDFIPQWKRSLLDQGLKHRDRQGQFSDSEIMTIVVLFHSSGYLTFKHFYLSHVQQHMSPLFPELVTYKRLIQLMQKVLVPLSAYLWCKSTGISYVDSTPLKVCHNKRIPRHKTFKGMANRGKTSMGWFYGFKLHLVVNDKGDILSFCLTSGNRDDRKPLAFLSQDLWGQLFGDKGYVGQKYIDLLAQQGVQLITSLKRNMKPRILDECDKILLRGRSIIETINDQLKNVCQIDHSRHRSGHNFVVNLIAGLVSYAHKPKKPSLNIKHHFEQDMNPIAL